MFSGIGELITHTGNRIRLSVDMVGLEGSGRIGQLRCETAGLDPIDFLYPMRLRCEDGPLLDIAVTNYSGRHISFVGRLASEAETGAPAPLPCFSGGEPDDTERTESGDEHCHD